MGQAHPEKSWGDYVPAGLSVRLGTVSNIMVPPLRPLRHNSATPIARTYKKSILIRSQNGRNGNGLLKRMVLSEQLKEYITERCRHRIKFVPHDSCQLKDNVRNRIFHELIQVYKQELPVSHASPARSHACPDAVSYTN